MTHGQTPDQTPEETPEETPDGLAPELLEIIRCPACLGEFLPPEPAALVCSSCGLRYPVRNGVPILLVDEAEQAGDGASPAGTD
jgi:uncharacterized protein YbaR (Trm112 family)